MSKTEKKSDAKKADEGVIDPQMTSPSKTPESEKPASTATMPNSKERLASRTGRGNGGGEVDSGHTPRVGRMPEPTTLGERDGVPPSDHDLIWTNESKDNWQNGQPSHGDLLKQHAKVNRAVSEKK